jgi:hypothetical protein
MANEAWYWFCAGIVHAVVGVMWCIPGKPHRMAKSIFLEWRQVEESRRQGHGELQS